LVEDDMILIQCLILILSLILILILSHHQCLR
jgi:hypothetical protein